MADRQLFTNNAAALLASPISDSSTALSVMAGYGSLFPQPIEAGDYFLVTLENETATAREIVRVTGRTGDTFTGLVRGQEGTTPQAWSATAGSDTLVDHRVTAETMRLAMELPELGGVTVPSVTVPATTTGITTNVTYSDTERMHKFWVQMYDPVSGNAQAFEIYTVIRGLLSTNTEYVTYNQTNRIGTHFNGDISVQLDTTNKVLSLEWINNDPTINVVVTVTRI